MNIMSGFKLAAGAALFSLVVSAATCGGCVACGAIASKTAALKEQERDRKTYLEEIPAATKRPTRRLASH